MRIKDGFKLRSMAGVDMVVGEGLEQIDFSKIVSLNETASFLWKSVQGKDFDEDGLVRLLLDKYDVDEAVARRDVAALVDKWTETGLLER